MDKGSINIFEVKITKKDLAFKISSAQVFNQYLYLGDQKGTIYYYPIRSGQNQIIPKNAQQQSKSITKAKIDKILSYKPIGLLVILSDEKVFVTDASFKNIQVIASKAHDFALNQPFVKQGGLYSIVVISRKKQGMIFYYNPITKKFQDTKSRFQIADLPNVMGYTGYSISLGYKKDYQSLNIQKSFAVKKGPLQAKSPFLKVTGQNQVLYFSDDIGIFMSPDFMPKQKDNIFVNKPIINITQCGNYCLILCQGLIQVYTTFDSKKFNLIQQIPFNNVRGITSDRPFIYGKQQIYFLYEIPYQIQIKSLLEKGRVDDAIYLLVQNSGQDQKKIEQIKIDAVWPLIRKMQFTKAKQLISDIQFDIRELVLLFPQLISIQNETFGNSKPDKSISTMIIQYLNEKTNKGKQDEAQLKRKAKLFLKDVLQNKRDSYLSKGNGSKLKIKFNVSKYSLIKPRLQDITVQNLLQIIDFTLIKWFLQMSYFRQLQEFFLTNPIIYCKNLFEQIQNSIKSNAKLVQFPTLKPRLYMAFDKLQQAYEGWKIVAQNNPKQNLVKNACEQAVKLLAAFDNKKGILKKLNWIFTKNPQIGMSFFKIVDINSISLDQIIRQFQQEGELKYLQLFLQIIVNGKKTEIQAYHTKLISLYIDNLYKIHSKDAKQESKQVDFQQKILKMRKFLKSPQAKYASQPILRKIQNSPWMMEDQIFLYSRQRRHQDALKKYIKKNMNTQAQRYCRQNGDKTLTIYFKMLLKMYNYFQTSNNSDTIFLKKDIIIFLKKYSSNSQLDPIVVLQLIPDNWMLNEQQGGLYQFLQSAIIHTLHQKRTAYTSKHLSQMDLLTSQHNLIQAKRAYLKFTYKKKCLKCDMPIADKFFVVYPNANVFHQSCAKGCSPTVCPKTNQDFQKTFKY